MKKIAIYDRYLSTAGGGERYSCKMAEVLSNIPGYSVYLITDLFADLDDVSKKLNLDLSNVSLKVFPYISDDYAMRLTEEYDLFINATYLSALPAYGEKSIYLCYFPTPFNVDFGPLHHFLLIFFRLPALWLFRLAGKLTGGFRDIEIEQGLYEPKRYMLRRSSWTSGNAVIRAKKGNIFRLGIKNPSSSMLDDMKVKVTAYGIGDDSRPEFEYKTVLKKGCRETVDPGFKGSKPLEIRIETDTFTPSSGDNTTADSRKLGAALYDESRTGMLRKVILKFIGYVPLFLITYPANLEFLDSYQKIISISEYSSRWIKKYWDRESTMLFPPVDTVSFAAAEGNTKEKAILSVGRFFPEHHNKKQYELVRAFIGLKDKYPRDMKGYTLYLAGGMEDRNSHKEYVEKIKALAKGYPVKIMVNLSFSRLAELFKKASIFWHASGLGENEESHPEKFEHFGITTVEAMSAGCIPVVIDKGGQKEIVEDGLDGFLFTDLEELKQKTLDLVRGNFDIQALRKNAIADSQRFSNEKFAEDLLLIAKETLEDDRQGK